jgi:hypothetical protein
MALGGVAEPPPKSKIDSRNNPQELWACEWLSTRVLLVPGFGHLKG